MTVAALAASLALMSGVGVVAAAGPPEGVTIVSPMTITLPDEPNQGTFTATGSDLICSSGAVQDTRYVWSGPRMPQAMGSNPSGAQLVVDKTFTCPDGQIFFRLQIHGVFVSETFSWVILGGSGSYAGLHGAGQGTTESGTTSTNTYTGFLVN